MLLAKRTTYHGQVFSSRLEGRWAYFLSALSIPWEYEKEAYQLGDIVYIPDFYLGFAWLETKGELITDEIGLQVIRKCTRLAALSGIPVILAFNDPLDQRCAVFGKKGGFYPNAHFSVCRTCSAFGVLVRHLEETRFVCSRGQECAPVSLPQIRAARRHAFDAAMAARQHKFGISRKAA